MHFHRTGISRDSSGNVKRTGWDLTISTRWNIRFSTFLLPPDSEWKRGRRFVIELGRFHALLTWK